MWNMVLYKVQKNRFKEIYVIVEVRENTDKIEVAVIEKATYHDEFTSLKNSRDKFKAYWITSIEGSTWYNPFTWFKLPYHERRVRDGFYLRLHRELYPTVVEAIEFVDQVVMKTQLKKEKERMEKETLKGNLEVIKDNLESIKDQKKHISAAMSDLDQLLSA